MTTAELAAYYANLLIIQYIGKPNAYATVLAQVTPALIDQVPLAVQNAFSVDTAVGVQLDVIGKYVGVSRSQYTPLPVSLNDDDYRTLIKMIIIKNNSGSSLGTIQSLVNTAFPGQVFISDNQSMGLAYILLESLGSTDLLDVLSTVANGYLPAPMGVQVSVTVVPSLTHPFFAFRTYSDPSTGSPFNNYASYQLTYPWLTYGG